MAKHQPTSQLALGGLVPFTTIDFPGRLAAVLFCQGCPWRCSYCHNQHLQPRSACTPNNALHWSQVLDWLASRQGLIDGVVFSGGEPLLQSSLPDAIAEVRAMGFATALHTAGIYPQRLAAVLPLLDWVGFDVKAPFDAYAPIVGCNGDPAARESLQLLLTSGVDYDIRCTVPPQLDAAAQQRLQAEVLALGGKPPIWQTCRLPEPKRAPETSVIQLHRPAKTRLAASQAA